MSDNHENKIPNTIKSILCYIKIYILNSKMAWTDLIEKHKHDFYHFHHFTIKCEMCTFDYKLPKKRMLSTEHLYILFGPHEKIYDIKARSCSDSEIDLDILECIIECCDSMFWFYLLEWKNKTLQQFLNEFKHDMCHIVHESQGCCQYEISDTRKSEYGITKEQLTLLFETKPQECISCTNRSNSSACILQATARNDVTIDQLYAEDITLMKRLLQLHCPLKRYMQQLVRLGKEILNPDLTCALYEECDTKLQRVLHYLEKEVQHKLDCSDLPDLSTLACGDGDRQRLLRKKWKSTDQSVDDGQPANISAHFHHQSNILMMSSMATSEVTVENGVTSDMNLKQYNISEPYRTTYIVRKDIQRSTVGIPYTMASKAISPRSQLVHLTAVPGGIYFTTPQQRLASFSNWSLHTRYWPSPLAEAGFFYTGTGRIVRCFMCDYTGSVEEWIQPETPKEAHARLCPDCKYVLNMGFKKCEFPDLMCANELSTEITNCSISNPAHSDMTIDRPIETNKEIAELENITGQTAEQESCHLTTTLTKTNHTISIAVSTDLSTDIQAGTDNVFSPDTYVTNNEDNTQTVQNWDETNYSDGLTVYSDGMKDLFINSSNLIERGNYKNEVANDHEAKLEADFKHNFSDGFTMEQTKFYAGNLNLDTKLTNAAQLKDFNNSERSRALNLNTSAVVSSIKFKYPQFQLFNVRLQSFSNWKYTSKQQPNSLAYAGYFYTGDADIVRCFCCDLGLAEWDEKDDVWVEHARHNPGCWFLKTEKGDEYIKSVQLKWRKIYNPKHPAFEDREARLATFECSWRTDIEQTPESLVDAGFFYTGEEDVVRCHYCDGGLKNWENGDIPWEEHARWFPFCKFVIKMKGREYIDAIRYKYETKEHDEQLQSHAEDPFTKHPFVQHLVDLSFERGDILSAMRQFKWTEGHTDFSLEDLIEIITSETFQKQKQSTAFIGNHIPQNTENKDPAKLKEINRQLKEQLLCVRCKTEEISMLFTNCGHRITCEKCANELEQCPNCNRKIKKCIKTFLS